MNGNGISVQEILRARELDRPDGRGLFSYRVTDQEFATLDAGLRARSAQLQRGHLANAFVLWGAERFRRAFSGGAWSWDVLMEPLGLTLSHGQRVELAKKGLAFWKRPLRRTDHARQYLFSIAAEGGIPSALLEKEAGAFKLQLASTLRDLGRIGPLDPEIAMQIAASHSHLLPQAFRGQEITALVGDLAYAVLELRAAIPDAARQVDPMGWLARNRPDWRDSLPIELGDTTAAGLLADIIRNDTRQLITASQIARRILLHRGEGWSPAIRFEDRADLPLDFMLTEAPQAQSARLFAGSGLDMTNPRLSLSAKRRETTWRLQVLSGPGTLEAPLALEVPAILTAVVDGREIEQLEAPGAPTVSLADGSSFWLPEAGTSDTDLPDRLHHVGEGEVRTTRPRIFLLCAADQAPVSDDSLTCQPVGHGGENACLYELRGEGRIRIGADVLAVATAASDERRWMLHLVGDRLRGCVDDRGAPVFLGWPTVWGGLHEGAQRRLGHTSLKWRAVGERSWRPLSADAPIGRVTLGWFAGDVCRARATACIAPRELRVDGQSYDADGAAILVSGAPSGAIVTIDAVGLDPASSREIEGEAEVLLHARGAPPTAVRMRISVPERSGVRQLLLRLPYPQSCGLFISPEGRKGAPDERLSLDALRGWRAIAPSGRHAWLRLRVRNPGAEQAPDMAVHAPMGHETSLNAQESMIATMLAAVGSRDAEARLRVVADGIEGSRIVVQRCTGKWRLAGAELWSDGTASAPRRLHAIHLFAPDQSRTLDVDGFPLDLSRALSDVTGPWLIFDVDRSAFRPMFWSGAPDAPNAGAQFSDRFVEASALPTATARISQLAQTLQDMTKEPESDDWTLLEQQIDELTAIDASPCWLDTVLALPHAESAAVVLLFRANRNQILTRLDLELHTSLHWPSIRHDAWSAGLRCAQHALRRKLAGVFEEDEATEQADRVIVSRAIEIRNARPELAAHLVFALNAVGLTKQTPEALRLPMLPSTFFTNGLHQFATEAIRRAGEISVIGGNDFRALRPPDSFHSFDSQWRPLIDAPLIAAEIASGARFEMGSFKLMAFLRQAQILDPAYFASALPFAVAIN